QIHESAVVGKNVVLKDWGVIGPRAVIGEGAKLAQCVVWEGADRQWSGGLCAAEGFD
ncbi:MAG: hypothetical protein D3911_06840, partial [Candidatus Electrothrix sp. AW3_4]|nr:hypothetical protein [Candidatus Electrothrix gigas]